MDLLTKVQNRELGEFPVSFGTSMAILLVGDSNKESPSIKEAKEKPEQLWINIGTLFRNMESVIDKTVTAKLTSDITVPVLLEEIRLIVNYVREIYADKMRVVFYQSDYVWLHKEFPRAGVKTPTTELQKNYDRILKQTLRAIKKPMRDLIKEDFTLGDRAYVDYHVFEDFPQAEFKTLWVLTHHPVDLLGFKRTKKVQLLESQTARLRSKYEWNAKLTGKKVEHMPFNKLTIQIFGDQGTNFSSMGAKYKKVLFDVAKERKWNPTTSVTMVDYHLSNIKDHFSGNVLRMMLK